MNDVMLGALGGQDDIHSSRKEWMKPHLLGAVGLLIRSLSVTETAGSLHGLDLLGSKKTRSQSFYATLAYVIKTCGMKLTEHSKGVLGKICRGQQDSYALSRGLNLSYVDRSAYSGLNVLMGLLEVFLDNDSTFLEKNSVDSILSFVRPLVGMDHVLAIKRLKYVTSYWFAKFLHDEKPPADYLAKGEKEDHWLFVGSVRRYLRDRLVSVTARNAKFFYSLLQTKRSCDVVPESFIQMALEKHRKALMTPCKPITNDLQRKIEDKTDQILAHWTSFKDRQCEPSHSASFEVGRCGGGQQRALIEQYGDMESFGKAPDDLVGMVEVRPGVIEERRGWVMPSRIDMLHSAFVHEHGQPSIEVRTTEIASVGFPEGEAPHVTWSVRDIEVPGPVFLSIPAIEPQGQMTAKVATVLEPLKVRPVTKGRAQAYSAVHGIQKWMHGNLRRASVFKFGQTVDESLIQDQVFKRRKPGESFISGDYSAATDNLKIAVTKTIFERILIRLAKDLEYSDEAVELTLLARRVLYEHRISYPKASGLEDIIQASGQLMGSPLSFPILCLANCICCWITLFDEYAFEDLPILVNGDDISFACSLERYALWSSRLEDYGFFKSVGKNYCHKRFMIINSELFDSKYELTGRCHLPYFASGLLMGRSKVCKNEDALEAPPVVVSLQLCLRGSQNPERTLSRFMAYNHEKVEKVTCRKTALFLPITRGVLGLDSSGVKYHVSLWQRRYAAYLASQSVLRTNHFVREADEAGQWMPSYRVLDTDLRPDMSQYEVLPGLIDDRTGEDVTEQTWLPGLSGIERKLFLQRIYARTRDYQQEIAPTGPTGWKIMDNEGRTTWKSHLNGSTLRKIQRQTPLAGNLLDELPYRYSSYKPVRASVGVSASADAVSTCEWIDNQEDVYGGGYVACR